MANNIDDLAKEINKTLAEYANGIGEEVEAIAQKVAKDGVKKLRVAGEFEDRTGKYRKGWRAKKVDNKWTVYNTQGQRTHLLERSHALANGGRSRAFTHIEPVEKEMITEFTNGVEEAIRR